VTNAYPQGDGCPEHPGPLVHWTQRDPMYSCWECDIRWVYVGSAPHDQWVASQMDGEQFRLSLAVAA
jgi:hypothetical protein